MAVEVGGGERPGEVPVQMQGAFDLVEGMKDGWVVGVVAFVSDGCSFVVVHTCLDAAGLELVPATVIRVNDWTSMDERWVWPRPVWAGPSG
ncbi:hypothetical protein [Rhodococcus sp. 077-4]|uniref:hypothetical protein n=1 Tax=Rhodococcus sp. 077-4 TaxID=2789271 RepID=UPI0039F4B8DE